MLRTMLAACVAVAGLAGVPQPASAQDFTFRLHQMLPEQAAIPARFLKPWAEKVEAESGGRIRIELYPSMQLGGKPPALIDQVTDGFVDFAWTVLGYTPGRFPKSEAFELPFMVTTGEATSKAFQAFYERHLTDEFPGLKVIAVHTHGAGLLHTAKPVATLADLKDMKLRGPTRVITDMLGTFGAVPVGMPVPAVPESLSKGVIDGAVIPWEVTLPLKVSELVKNHTELSGRNGLYTATFVFAMNRASYDRLPDDLKKVIDDNSGVEAAGWAGRSMDEVDVIGRKKAQDAGNTIIVLGEDEVARWRAAAQPVIDKWIADMTAKGIDGAGLVKEAQELVNQYSGS